MNIQIVIFKITGIKPLIQSNPHGMWKAPEFDEDGKLVKAKRKAGLRGTDSEDFLHAKEQLYVNEDSFHYHPAIGFLSGLQMACAGRNLGNTSALTVVMRTVTLMEAEFILCDPATLDTKTPVPLMDPSPVKWQIDYRRAVNPNKQTQQGGVGVVAIRPKWRQWGGLVPFEVDMDFYKTLEGLTDLLNLAGHYYGLGVGRMRVKAIVNRVPVWSGFGSGKYSAELMEK